MSSPARAAVSGLGTPGPAQLDAPGQVADSAAPADSGRAEAGVGAPAQEPGHDSRSAAPRAAPQPAPQHAEAADAGPPAAGAGLLGAAPQAAPAPGRAAAAEDVIELLSDDEDVAGSPRRAGAEVLDLTQSPPGSPPPANGAAAPPAPATRALPPSLQRVVGGDAPAAAGGGALVANALGKRALPPSLAQADAAAPPAAKRAAVGAGASSPAGAPAGAPGGAQRDLRWDAPRTGEQQTALAAALNAALARRRTVERGPVAGSALPPGRAPAAPWLRPGLDALARPGPGPPAGADAGGYGSAFGAPVRSPYAGIARAAGAVAHQVYTAVTGERRLPPSLQAAGQVVMSGLGVNGGGGGGGGGARLPAHATHTEADAQVPVSLLAPAWLKPTS